MEDRELEQLDTAAQGHWEHVNQVCSWGLDGHHYCQSPSLPTWDCFHTSSNPPQSSALGLDKENRDTAPSPPRSSAEISELFESPGSHSSRFLSPDSSATPSLCDAQEELNDSTIQSSTFLGNRKPIVPELKSCPHCSYKASAHGVSYVRYSEL